MADEEKAAAEEEEDTKQEKEQAEDTEEEEEEDIQRRSSACSQQPACLVGLARHLRDLALGRRSGGRLRRLALAVPRDRILEVLFLGLLFPCQVFAGVRVRVAVSLPSRRRRRRRSVKS